MVDFYELLYTANNYKNIGKEIEEAGNLKIAMKCIKIQGIITLKGYKNAVIDSLEQNEPRT